MVIRHKVTHLEMVTTCKNSFLRHTTSVLYYTNLQHIKPVPETVVRCIELLCEVRSHLMGTECSNSDHGLVSLGGEVVHGVAVVKVEKDFGQFHTYL